MNKFSQKNKEFISKITDENGGKLLDCEWHRKIFCHQRNRVDSTYYLTKTKGNWIKSFRIRHLLNGEPQNLFMSFMVGGLLDPQKAQDNASHTETVKELIVKTKFNEHEKHFQLFKQLTPDLDWFDDNDEEENDNTPI